MHPGYVLQFRDVTFIGLLQVTTKRPGGIGFAADAWGLACTILELASGAPPFSGQAGVHNVMDVLNVLMNVRSLSPRCYAVT